MNSHYLDRILSANVLTTIVVENLGNEPILNGLLKSISKLKKQSPVFTPGSYHSLSRGRIVENLDGACSLNMRKLNLCACTAARTAGLTINTQQRKFKSRIEQTRCFA